ncbi:MAG TPA: ankyrin repeat domain-containing protein [Vineibacter sp.]|nr:ankyrin repeat domain-containing protein [Vineibacter sp.]
MKLDDAEVKYLQEKFRDLLNWQSADMFEPIDPLTWVEPSGDNLLHVAAMRADSSSVELLLKAGMEVNKPGDMGYTALHYAYWKKETDELMRERDAVIELLLKYGASTDVRNEFGRTPVESGDI